MCLDKHKRTHHSIPTRQPHISTPTQTQNISTSSQYSFTNLAGEIPKSTGGNLQSPEFGDVTGTRRQRRKDSKPSRPYRRRDRDWFHFGIRFSFHSNFGLSHVRMCLSGCLIKKMTRTELARDRGTPERTTESIDEIVSSCFGGCRRCMESSRIS
ncbi:hypothetical protein Hdeb2414_s0004g00130051 [Helianthus debilis subsp. tardiflorus]